MYTESRRNGSGGEIMPTVRTSRLLGDEDRIYFSMHTPVRDALQGDLFYCKTIGSPSICTFRNDRGNAPHVPEPTFRFRRTAAVERFPFLKLIKFLIY